MSGRMGIIIVLGFAASIVLGAVVAGAMTDEELKAAVERAKQYLKDHPAGIDTVPAVTPAVAPVTKGMTDEELKAAVERAKQYLKDHPAGTGTAPAVTLTVAPVATPKGTPKVTPTAPAAKVEEKSVKTEPNRDIPQITLTNGLVNMTVYLPDAQRGYYRGMRFNWSGLIARAEYAGHSFYGPFRTQFNPMLHDHVVGPADEFDMENPPPGFNEAELGQPFLKIGVGVLQKGPDEKYNAFTTMNIIQAGTWKVTNGRDWAEFNQRLTYGKWGYQYIKRISLVKGAGGFVISHSLQNVGTDPIDSVWYCHNFTIIDDVPVGPAYKVSFPFSVQLMDKPVGDVKAETSRLHIGEISKEKPIWTIIETGKDKVADDQVAVENTKTGAGLKIVGDQPVQEWRFYAESTAACPEPFLRIHVGPGEKMAWSYTYTFLVPGAEKGSAAPKAAAK
jgi:hypothetical protein